MSTSPANLQRDVLAKAWTVPYYVKGLALGVPTYLAAIHLWTWVLTLPVYVGGRADFRQLYAAGALVRAGEAKHLYDYQTQKHFQDNLVSREQVALPFFSLPYEAAVFAPSSIFSFRTAYLIFVAFNIALLGVCFRLLWPWMSNLRAIYHWLPLTIFAGFLPVAAALIQGQDSILLLTLLVGAFVCLSKELDFTAGVLVGLGLFKFTITTPLALLFLVWRRWSCFLGFLISAAGLACWSVWLVGIDQTKLYIESLMSVAGLRPVTTELAQYPVALQLMANIHGFIFGIAGTWMSKLWLEAVTIFLAGAILAWTALRGLRIDSTPALLLTAIPCAVLVSHHVYIHDLSVLLLPVIVLLNCFLPAESQAKRQRERLIGRAAVLMFVAPVAISFLPQHFYLVSMAVFILLAASAADRDRQQTLI